MSPLVCRGLYRWSKGLKIQRTLWSSLVLVLCILVLRWKRMDCSTKHAKEVILLCSNSQQSIPLFQWWPVTKYNLHTQWCKSEQQVSQTLAIHIYGFKVPPFTFNLCVLGFSCKQVWQPVVVLYVIKLICSLACDGTICLPPHSYYSGCRSHLRFF